MAEKPGPEVWAKSALVGAAGWLVPGFGHLLLGRKLKAGLFCGLIFACYLIGYAISGGTCVNRRDHPYSYYAQVGVGSLTLWLNSIHTAEEPRRPTSRQTAFLPGTSVREATPVRCVACGRIEELPAGGLVAPCPECGGRKHKPVRHLYVPGLDLGLLYTMVAGLLNLLVAADAFDQAGRR